MKPRLAATALVAASACALALGACTPGDTAQSSSSPAAKGGGDGNYTIAVVPKDATNPWFVRMETGVKKYAEDTGMNAFQKGPAETDATMQAQVIQDLIAKRRRHLRRPRRPRSHRTRPQAGHGRRHRRRHPRRRLPAEHDVRHRSLQQQRIRCVHHGQPRPSHG